MSIEGKADGLVAVDHHIGGAFWRLVRCCAVKGQVIQEVSKDYHVSRLDRIVVKRLTSRRHGRGRLRRLQERGTGECRAQAGRSDRQSSKRFSFFLRNTSLPVCYCFQQRRWSGIAVERRKCCGGGLVLFWHRGHPHHRRDRRRPGGLKRGAVQRLEGQLSTTHAGFQCVRKISYHWGRCFPDACGCSSFAGDSCAARAHRANSCRWSE